MQIFFSLLFFFSCFFFEKLQGKAFEELRILVKIKHEIMKKKRGDLKFLCSEENPSSRLCDYQVSVRKRGVFVGLCSLGGGFRPRALGRYYLIERRCSSLLGYFDRRNYFFF